MTILSLQPAVIATLLLTGLAVVAVVGGLGILWATRANHTLLRRATATPEAIPRVFRQHQTVAPRPLPERLVDQLAARLPVGPEGVADLAPLLTQAGVYHPKALQAFHVLRIGGATLLTALAVVLAPWGSPLIAVALVLGTAILGLRAPQLLLQSRAAERQALLRRGVPDALDLLVVCIEAGVSLDAALQRVARELEMLHPALAAELAAMNRRIAAGMARADALEALHLQTGVDELRGLATTLVQSDQWGTPIGGALRTYADQLRQQRKVAAEKQAATAGTRMLLPLTLFIFPTLFIVLLGPAIIQIGSSLSQMTPPSVSMSAAP